MNALFPDVQGQMLGNQSRTSRVVYSIYFPYTLKMESMKKLDVCPCRPLIDFVPILLANDYLVLNDVTHRYLCSEKFHVIYPKTIILKVHRNT